MWQTNFDKAVTVGRQEIETRANELLQSILDQYGAGIAAGIEARHGQTALSASDLR